MDGNFNNEQNNFNEDDYNETLKNKKFDEVAPNHLPENIAKAKTAFDLGLIALLGSLGSIFAYFFLQRIIFVMVLLPILAIGGIVAGILAIKNDKGLPKAYIGLILGILSLIPSLICVLLFVVDMLARF